MKLESDDRRKCLFSSFILLTRSILQTLHRTTSIAWRRKRNFLPQPCNNSEIAMKDWIRSFSADEWSRWAPALQTIMHVTVILILAWALYRFVHRLLQKFRTYMSLKVTSTEEVKRM